MGLLKKPLTVILIFLALFSTFTFLQFQFAYADGEALHTT